MFWRFSLLISTGLKVPVLFFGVIMVTFHIQIDIIEFLIVQVSALVGGYLLALVFVKKGWVDVQKKDES